LWQEHASRLWLGLESSETASFGLVDLRIALQRLLVDLEQRGGIGACWRDFSSYRIPDWGRHWAIGVILYYITKPVGKKRFRS
jgi:hypothetical protein